METLLKDNNFHMRVSNMNRERTDGPRYIDHMQDRLEKTKQLLFIAMECLGEFEDELRDGVARVPNEEKLLHSIQHIRQSWQALATDIGMAIDEANSQPHLGRGGGRSR